jgi:hypothetical protein
MLALTILHQPHDAEIPAIVTFREISNYVLDNVKSAFARILNLTVK